MVKAEITANKNMVPLMKITFCNIWYSFGATAITTRGLVEDDMEQVVDLIDRTIKNHLDEDVLQSISKEVHELMSHRPLFVA